MNLGEQLRKVRQLRGLSQDYLGKEIGMDQNAISRFENNKSIPGLIQLQKMAEVLNVRLIDLLKFDERELLKSHPEPDEKYCESCVWKLMMLHIQSKASGIQQAGSQ